MKIPYLKEEILLALKEQININKDKYLNDESIWIDEEYKDVKAYDFLNKEVPNIELKMYAQTKEELIQEDIENIKILYSGLKGISDSQATDERLWAGLTHINFIKYVQHRFKILNDINDEKIDIKILVAFFFNTKRDGNIRPLVLNYIARLWWAGRLIYDENSDNPYSLLKTFYHDQSSLLLWSSRSYSNNRSIIRGAMKAINEFENNGTEITRTMRNIVRKNLNIMSGVVLLDYMNEDDIYDIVKEDINKHLNDNNVDEEGIDETEY